MKEVLLKQVLNKWILYECKKFKSILSKNQQIIDYNLLKISSFNQVYFKI